MTLRTQGSMNQKFMDGLANNASMLLALFIVYELSCLISRRLRLLRQILSGLLISGICIAIMAMPFELSPGVVFDTRSILISITGLLFRVIPTAITAILAIVFRISLGGDGMLMGIAVITVSALIGLAWRRWLYPKQKKWRFLNFLLMGIFVHAAMLACVNLIPYPQNLMIWREISLPVMLIYPVTSVLLSMLLLQLQERRTYQKQLQLSEEKYRRIAENSSDIIWTSDANLHTTYVSPSVEKILGESAESHMQRICRKNFRPALWTSSARCSQKSLSWKPTRSALKTGRALSSWNTTELTGSYGMAVHEYIYIERPRRQADRLSWHKPRYHGAEAGGDLAKKNATCRAHTLISSMS